MAINSRDSIKQAFLLDMTGGFTKLCSFSFNFDTEVADSCSLVFQGKMYVFGGSLSSGKTNQISQVSGCKLIRIGTLNFNLNSGACTVTQTSKIMVCFDFTNGEGKVCRISNSPTGTFVKISHSNYHHYTTSIASTGGL